MDKGEWTLAQVKISWLIALSLAPFRFKQTGSLLGGEGLGYSFYEWVLGVARYLGEATCA